ncbi:hypothetical protein RRG08_042361 [Elysia crispata]|uniref:Uncharacterized protein n=1 Tax=Elysia crispata TaxID=231223 RepID=A0AAE0ZC63_9GAST|nr:hypothetical protein RRG08_042361 [Elysia crispata]
MVDRSSTSGALAERRAASAQLEIVSTKHAGDHIRAGDALWKVNPRTSTVWPKAIQRSILMTRLKLRGLFGGKVDIFENIRVIIQT